METILWLTSKRLFHIITFSARKYTLLQWNSAEGASVKGWCKFVFELVPLNALQAFYKSKQISYTKSGSPI